MSLYEFAGNFYVAAFLKRTIGNIFINTRFSKPEFLLYHNMGITTFSVEQLFAQEVEAARLQSMERGFFESGAGLNNLIRFNYADVGYLGLGLSAFYRYGPYQLSTERKPGLQA